VFVFYLTFNMWNMLSAFTWSVSEENSVRSSYKREGILCTDRYFSSHLITIQWLRINDELVRLVPYKSSQWHVQDTDCMTACQPIRRFAKPLGSVSCKPIILNRRSLCFQEARRLLSKCDGTRAENRFRLSAKRTSPFKSAWGVSSFDYWQPRCAHQR